MSVNWDNLPGKVTIKEDHASRLMENRTVFHGAHRVDDVYKIGCSIPVTNDMMRDTPFDLMQAVANEMDRVFRPWAYPDLPWRIGFTPFPRWDKLMRKLRR